MADWVRLNSAGVVRGNHDKAAVGLDDLEWFNPVARAAAIWTQHELTPENAGYIRNLPKGPVALDGFQMVHGSPLDEDEYILAVADAGLVFGYLETPLTFFGHTHLQGGFTFNIKEGKTRSFAPKYPNADQVVKAELLLEPGERYLINPGSVGQPRDNDWRAAFALYETNDDAPATVTFYRVPYDVEQTQARIVSSNLPERLATRLALGR